MAKIYKDKRETKKGFAAVMLIVLAILIVFAVWQVADSLTRAQNEETLDAAQKAIIKSSVQCYALEGQYPTGIEYLEENYGLTLDRTKYVYHYRSIGANMMPEVKVYPL